MPSCTRTSEHRCFSFASSPRPTKTLAWVDEKSPLPRRRVRRDPVGPRATTEEIVEEHDMRPSGSVEAWMCSVCGHTENVIDASDPAPTNQSRADLERSGR